MGRAPVTLAARFWGKVRRGDGCWLWTASLRDGYGRFWITPDKAVEAHRFAYELLVGPIPPGLVIDHLCRNRACQNPAHMEPVTNRANILRGEGVTATAARRDRCVNGHAFDREWGGRRYCGTCAAAVRKVRNEKRRARCAEAL